MGGAGAGTGSIKKIKHTGGTITLRLINADDVKNIICKYENRLIQRTMIYMIENMPGVVATDEQIIEICGKGMRKMTKSKALAIVKNIYTDEEDMEDKLSAIQEIVEMETHNSITKQELIDALRWILEVYL